MLNNFVPIKRSARFFSTAASSQQWPSWLCETQGGAADVLVSESNDILFNLATEEYIFEHLEVKNPLLFLWRNKPTIIIGKHQNPWKECHVQKLENDGIVLARRKSGGGCVYQDLGNSVFSFINPISAQQDFKTFNNDILIGSLDKFGVKAEASGRNDLVVDGRKISGSAYKLKLGRKDGSGRRSLHHGTMLLDLELNALSRYLNPSKAKMQSKGVDSVVSRVVNLTEVCPDINHANFCESLEEQFAQKWPDLPINRSVLSEKSLKEIPQLMSLYESYSKWEWRFGETPQFANSLEHKFDWALVDVQFNVEKGVIVAGKIFSDCLVPAFIDCLNDELATGSITYD